MFLPVCPLEISTILIESSLPMCPPAFSEKAPISQLRSEISDALASGNPREVEVEAEGRRLLPEEYHTDPNRRHLILVLSARAARVPRHAAAMWEGIGGSVACGVVLQDGYYRGGLSGDGADGHGATL